MSARDPRPEKIAGAIRGLERLKADFKMRGANATTIERAIDMLRTIAPPGSRVVPEGAVDAETAERCAAAHVLKERSK